MTEYGHGKPKHGDASIDTHRSQDEPLSISARPPESPSGMTRNIDRAHDTATEAATGHGPHAQDARRRAVHTVTSGTRKRWRIKHTPDVTKKQTNT